MVVTSLARWTFAEHARRPGTWAMAALFLAAWPLALTFASLGITTRNSPISAHSYELAFLAILAGIALGVDTLARGSWFLERASPVRRLTAEVGGLVGSLIFPMAAVLLATGFVAPEAAGLRASLVPIVLTSAHVLALGLVCLRVPIPPAARALLVPLSAWVLPALVATSASSDLGPSAAGATLRDGFAGLMSNLFEASRHGRSGLQIGADPSQRWGAILPITALVGAAWMLIRQAPTIHALRNPR